MYVNWITPVNVSLSGSGNWNLPEALTTQQKYFVIKTAAQVMKQKYISTSSSILLILFCTFSLSVAQEESIDETVTEASDTVETEGDGKDKSYNRIEISLDYLKLLTFAFPSETKLEAGIGFISKINIGIKVEVGYAEKTPEDFYNNEDYNAYGYYGSVGLRYYYRFNHGVKREDLEANWVELILGSESSVKGNLYFGFTFRMRFLIQSDNFEPFEVYFVPGYGRTFDNFVPALNLYVKYFIPFGKGR
jgi:hypothetical protein